MKKSARGYQLIFGYLGIFLVFAGIICLCPLVFLIGNSGELSFAKNFFIPGLGSIGVGIFLYMLIFGRQREKLEKYQDKILLVLIWLCSILVCSVPFILSREMSFTEAIFETTSGFSTIGLTRFFTEGKSDVFTTSRLYLSYRSFLLLFGGIGLVLVVTSILSDRYALKLYSTEGHNDKLLPNLGKSARLILSIYVGYIVLGILAYALIGRMDWFDAFNHSIAALATGGFSSRAGGILATGGNQVAIQIISCVLMLLGGTNFLIHLYLLTGKFKKVGKDLEIRFLGILFAIFIPLFALASTLGLESKNFGEGLAKGTFTFISAITTTGFSNISDIRMLGEGTLSLIVIINIIGGGIGSTAGGVKQYRVAVMFKTLYWNIRYRSGSSRMIYPYTIYKSGETKQISPSDALDCFGYFLIYVSILIFGTFAMTLFASGLGVSFGDCLFEYSNAISSTGLTNGVTAIANNGMMWCLIFAMFAGRLEILPLYFAIYRIVRDILRKETY